MKYYFPFGEELKPLKQQDRTLLQRDGSLHTTGISQAARAVLKFILFS